MSGSYRALAIVNDNNPARTRAPRTRVLLSCTLLTTTDEYRVKLRNLSASGAMMEGSKLPAAGTDVILRRGAIETFATVAWMDGSRGGLHFDEPLERLEDWAQIPVPAPLPVQALPAGKTSLRSLPLTREEQVMARAWVNSQERDGPGR